MQSSLCLICKKWSETPNNSLVHNIWTLSLLLQALKPLFNKAVDWTWDMKYMSNYCGTKTRPVDDDNEISDSNQATHTGWCYSC